jgi:hypothetical protein
MLGNSFSKKFSNMFENLGKATLPVSGFTVINVIALVF